MRLRPAFSPAGDDRVDLARLRRDLADAQVRRRRDLARRAVDLAPRQLLPGAPERREHRVRLELADVGDEVPRRAARLHARPRAARPRRARSRAMRERRDVGREVRRGGAVLAGELRQLALRLPAHDDELAARATRAARAGSRTGTRCGWATRRAAGRRARTPGRPARARPAPRAAAGGRGRAGRAGTRRARWQPSRRIRPGPRLDPRGTGPRLPAVPARDRRSAERTGAAAHLRGALQDDDRALPGGGVGVRDRLARRRRPAPDRLRVRDRRDAGADARRPAQPGRPRHAAVPDRGAPGRARLPGRHRRVPRRPRRGGRPGGGRRRPHRLRRPRRAGDRPDRPTRRRSPR